MGHPVEEGHDKVAPRPASYSTLAMSYVYQVTKYNIDNQKKLQQIFIMQFYYYHLFF